MAGTKEGGRKAALTNKSKFGHDFYRQIGARGGKNGKTGGFAAGDAGRERARIYGAIGGKISKRTPGKPKVPEPEESMYAIVPETTPVKKRRIFSFLNR